MAKTFKFGENGKWATKTGSSLAYNDQNDNFKPMPFSVTRDSIATRVNKEGLIEVVGNDKLRIDYTDSTKGVALLEPARTNLVTYSEDFSNAAWNLGSNAVLTYESNITAPDGSLGVYRLTLPATFNTFLQFQTGAGTTNYTGSIYAKTASVNNEGFNLFYGGLPSSRFTTNDDWLRYDYNDNGAQFTIVNFEDSFVTDIYIWGAQLEAGSYATSYIPTSGATYQRKSDVANGAGNSEVFNDSEGVLFANISALANDSTNRFLGISDGSLSNRVNILYGSTNVITGQIQGAGSLTADGVNILLFNKSALKYKSGDNQLWVNGFKVDFNTSTSGATVGLNVLDIEAGNGNFDFYGKAKEIGVYDTALTDAELEALTSYTSFTDMANELNLTIK